MKILKWTAVILALLIGAFLVGGLAMDNKYEIQRSVEISAPGEKVHALLMDLERWPEWTPWKDSDPTLAVTLGDIRKGKGARQTWTGRDGRGELEILEDDPASGIKFKMIMHFDEETQVPSEGFIRHETIGGKLKVTWSLKGAMPMPIFGAYFALAMDSLAGPDFEKGLNKLKAAAER